MSSASIRRRLSKCLPVGELPVAQGSHVFWCDRKVYHSVDDPKDEMDDCKNPDVNHRLSQTWLDYSISHADDEEEKEGKGVPTCVKYGYYDEHDFRKHIAAVRVGILFADVSAVLEKEY